MSLIVTFDQSIVSTSVVTAGGIISCSSIFDSNTINNIMGISSICYWSTTTTITITSFDATCRVGSTLTILGNIITSSDSFAPTMSSVSMTITLGIGETLTTVAALLDGPNTAGSCENSNFTAIRSVGTAGLPLYYSWSIAPTSTPLIPTFTFGGYGTFYASINLDWTFTSDTYTITLYVVSWLNVSDTRVIPFLKSPSPVPHIELIPGNSYFQQRNLAFNATSIATISPCLIGTAELTTTWSIARIPPNAISPTIPSASLAIASLILVPYTFIPGSYELSVTVTQLSTSTSTAVSSTSMVYVLVAPTDAPKRLSARFNLACSRVDFVFDSRTDLTGNHNCSLMIPTSTVALFGNPLYFTPIHLHLPSFIFLPFIPNSTNMLTTLGYLRNARCRYRLRLFMVIG
jgi:hypothetical protein